MSEDTSPYGEVEERVINTRDPLLLALLDACQAVRIEAEAIRNPKPRRLVQRKFANGDYEYRLLP